LRAGILNKLQPKAGFTIGLWLFLISFSAQSALSRPVADDGEPTRVHVVAAVLDVDKIYSVEQNLTLNLYIVFQWLDPGLAHSEPGVIVRELDEVWNPRLTIANTQRHWANSKADVEISPQGLVTYRLHVFGDFSQPMELHDFSQDSHIF
jgi:hypothetical protein